MDQNKSKLVKTDSSPILNLRNNKDANMRLLFIIFFVFCAFRAFSEPFDQGNPATGKALIKKSCISCHATLYGGDGSNIYTRPNHIVKTPEQLLSRIQFCNANIGAGWLPEEEIHAAAFLNRAYYHFR